MKKLLRLFLILLFLFVLALTLCSCKDDSGLYVCGIHNIAYEKVTATCITPGYDRYYCLNCSFENFENFVGPDSSAHNYKKEQIDEGCIHTTVSTCLICENSFSSISYSHKYELIEILDGQDYKECIFCSARISADYEKVPLSSNIPEAIHGDRYIKFQGSWGGLSRPHLIFNAYGLEYYNLHDIYYTLIDGTIMKASESDNSSTVSSYNMLTMHLFGGGYEWEYYAMWVYSSEVSGNVYIGGPIRSIASIELIYIPTKYTVSYRAPDGHIVYPSDAPKYISVDEPIAEQIVAAGAGKYKLPYTTVYDFKDLDPSAYGAVGGNYITLEYYT